MTRARITTGLLCLAIVGCAGAPAQKPSTPEYNRGYAEGFVDGKAEARKDERKDGATITCPDGRPILSGWIKSTDVRAPNISFSQMPAPGSDEGPWIDAHAADADTILALGGQLNALIDDTTDLLYAARSGNFCGGPE